jgi:hypothetical protein
MWGESYDATSNPVVWLDERMAPGYAQARSGGRILHAAGYLSRAGTIVSTHLVQGGLRWQEAVELAEVRDQLRRAGAPCPRIADEE